MNLRALSAVVITVFVLAASPGHGGEKRQAGDQPKAGTDAENTGKNIRDRSGDTATVFDQGNSEPDIQITANIRKAIVDDDSLSTNAHNVKVITNDRIVQLRGPVDSPAEKATIEAKAKSVSGVKKVVNQLEVDSD